MAKLQTFDNCKRWQHIFEVSKNGDLSTHQITGFKSIHIAYGQLDKELSLVFSDFYTDEAEAKEVAAKISNAAQEKNPEFYHDMP